jgi:hypothetical protein
MEINENAYTIVYTIGLEGIQDLGIGGLFPFDHLDMSQRVKYMGFTLNPNSYGKENWYYILSKIKK